MQGHVFYRIISNSASKSPPQQSSTLQFHRSIPLKLNQKRQETSSIAYLSSLMQTQNLLINKMAHNDANFTSRQPHTFVTQKTPSLLQTGKQQKRNHETQYGRNAFQMDMMAQTRKRLMKNQNALLNIVGQYHPGENWKRQNKGMQQTIHKARTYTIMPTKTNFLPSYKKRQNNIKLKQEFNNFIKKQDWQEQIKRQSTIKSFKRNITEPTTASYIRNRNQTQVQVKKDQTTDLYHFLKTETKAKRFKTQEPMKHYPQLSKRMTEMILKNQLKISEQPFDFSKVDKRKHFKLNTGS